MNISVFKNIDEISKASGNLIASQVIENPKCVLGLATGSTALIPYRTMIELFNNGAVSLKDVTTFNLDEYAGLEPENENSYHCFMNKNLFSKTDINTDKTNFLNGLATDIEKECKEYDERIEKAGGIDIQLLGIGSDGHIAFNEPCEFFPENTHIVELDERTIKDNSRFFNTIEEVPTKALTMGIGSIMKAKKIILIANGKNKAEAIKKMVKGEIDPMCPASILRLHPNVVVMLDEDAASLL